MMSRSSRRISICLMVPALAAFTACDRGSDPAPPSAPAKSPSPAAASTRVATPPPVDAVAYVRGNQSTPPAAAPTLPDGHPPVTDNPRTPPAATAAPGELKYDAPAGWTAQPPKSRMRLAQYVLPRAEGDPEDGELAISRAGGAVDMNIARWRGMFATATGEKVPDDAFKRESFDVGTLKMTVIDVTGRYTDAMSRGHSETTPVDYRMLGGIVEAPAGLWFFKAVGPAATMAQHRDAFMTMMRSVQFSDAP